jgi:alpha-tubulin suppressor-like RCC1 family protein
VYSFGNYANNALGLGDKALNIREPTLIPALKKNVVKIACGFGNTHCAALTGIFIIHIYLFFRRYRDICMGMQQRYFVYNHVNFLKLVSLVLDIKT